MARRIGSIACASPPFKCLAPRVALVGVLARVAVLVGLGRFARIPPVAGAPAGFAALFALKRGAVAGRSGSARLPVPALGSARAASIAVFSA